jgi:hypothetical protein
MIISTAFRVVHIESGEHQYETTQAGWCIRGGEIEEPKNVSSTSDIPDGRS